MASDASQNFALDVKAATAMDTPARKKSARRSLSTRLRFRPRAFSASTADTAAGRLSKTSSTTVLMEPRDSVATSGESETSTMGASPIVQRVQVSRSTRSCSTSAAGAGAGACGAASSSRHRQRGVLSGGHERQAASPASLAAATTPAARGTDVGAGLRQGGRESGEIKVEVMFRRHEFSSTRGKGLGLTVSPAKDVVGQTGSVPRGARIEEAEGCAQRAPPQQASTPLRPGDLLAQVNGQDVRRLPFSEVLRLLNAPTPHVITTTAPSTTTTIGSMFGSSSNSGSPARPHPLHPGNVTKALVRGSLSSAPVGPRTPGSGNGQCTAPPSTNRSRAPAAATPPSPAALAPPSPLARPGSPLRLGSSTKMSRGIAPLLTDLRRKSWRRKFSSRWGGGGGGSKKERARGRDSKTNSKTCTGAVSFFSSTEATPTNAYATSFSSKQAASADPWGGDTPGEKQSRMHRTRSMINSTLGRMSPRGILSPWVAEALEAKAFNVIPAVPPPPATPQSPAAAPPSPAGASPPEVAFHARPGSPAPRMTANNLAPLSPREPLSEQREPTHPGGGGAGAGGRRGSKLRYSLSLPQSDIWFGVADADEEEDDEDEEDEESVVEYSVVRQLSRETMMSSSSAFFPSDSEDDFFVKGEEGEEEEEEEQQEQQEQHRRRRLGRPLERRNESNTNCVDGAGTGNQLASPTPSSGRHQQPGALLRKQLDVAEVPLGEQEEEEIVALSSYLACAERGWPWAGQDVLWAEYVSLNGQHRWIRTENCRHALLLVPGSLYLLEFPKEAVTRYMSHGLSTRARGSWFLSLNASDLSHLSVPLTPKEPRPAEATSAAAAAAARRSSSAARSCAFSNRFEAGSGMILHKKGRGGACAWVECRSAASRDALVDVVSAWAQHAETKGKGKSKSAPPLRVELASVAQVSSEAFGGGRRGRKMATLTDERQKCPLW